MGKKVDLEPLDPNSKPRSAPIQRVVNQTSDLQPQQKNISASIEIQKNHHVDKNLTESERIAAELTQLRTDLQNLEISLISRIADVDDDRRHASTRIQRTLKTQRTHLDSRLRRQETILVIIFLLFVTLTVGSVGFIYSQFNTQRHQLRDAILILHQAIEQIPLTPTGQFNLSSAEQINTILTALTTITVSLSGVATHNSPSSPANQNVPAHPNAAPPPDSTNPPTQATPDSIPWFNWSGFPPNA